MEWIAFAVVLVFAHTIETIVGFGATILTVSLASQFMPIETMFMTLVTLGILHSSIIFGLEFRHVAWNILLRKILPLCLVGVCIAIPFRNQLSPAGMRSVLGIAVVTLSFFQILRQWRLRRLDTLDAEHTRPTRLGDKLSFAIFLIGGGFYHGLFAVGGPMVVYALARSSLRIEQTRATLAVLWLGLNSAVLSEWILSEQFALQWKTQLALTSMLAPAILLAFAFGRFARSKEIDPLVSFGILGACGFAILGS